MKQISLTQWQFALVDDEDFEELNKYKWCALKQWNWKFYVVRSSKRVNGKRPLIYMHITLMNTPKEMHTDHIDGNWLNNQRNNLRICTVSENAMNRGKNKTNTSGFKGVYWNKALNKWQAGIQINWKLKHLWLFDNKLEAYRVYCEKCIKYHWEFYHL